MRSCPALIGFVHGPFGRSKKLCLVGPTLSNAFGHTFFDKFGHLASKKHDLKFDSFDLITDKRPSSTQKP